MKAERRRRKSRRQPRELTRQGVAERLKIARTTVRRWEGTLLHPRVKPNGVRVFDPVEVEQLAKSRPGPPVDTDDEGEMCARAIEMFRGGADVTDVVAALRRPIDWVRHVYAVHRGAYDQRFLTVDQWRTLEAAIGRPLTPEDLVETVVRMRNRGANGNGRGEDDHRT